jgi:hypothetical protein
MRNLELLDQLEDTFYKYIFDSKLGKTDKTLHNKLISLIEENESILKTGSVEKIYVMFPNDYYLSDVPIKNFLDFKISTDYGDTVFGRCEGDDTYISMPKTEYAKIQEYKQNIK